VWLKDPRNGSNCIAIVEKQEKNFFIARLPDGEERKIPGNSAGLEKVDPAALKSNVDDLSHLGNLSKAAVFARAAARYQDQHSFTWVGSSIMLSIAPTINVKSGGNNRTGLSPKEQRQLDVLDSMRQADGYRLRKEYIPPNAHGVAAAALQVGLLLTFLASKPCKYSSFLLLVIFLLILGRITALYCRKETRFLICIPDQPDTLTSSSPHFSSHFFSSSPARPGHGQEWQVPDNNFQWVLRQ
jgi:hypothetical protein